MGVAYFLYSRAEDAEAARNEDEHIAAEEKRD